MPPTQLSCGRAETRRCVVSRPSRNVRDFTCDSNTLSVGLRAASVGLVKAKRPIIEVVRCIMAVQDDSTQRAIDTGSHAGPERMLTTSVCSVLE